MKYLKRAIYDVLQALAVFGLFTSAVLPSILSIKYQNPHFLWPYAIALVIWWAFSIEERAE